MKTKDVYNHGKMGKKGLDITRAGIFNMQMNRRKVRFMKTSKKMNPKLRTLFPVTFVLGLQKIGTFSPKFLFPGFFPETFFL